MNNATNCKALKPLLCVTLTVSIILSFIYMKHMTYIGTLPNVASSFALKLFDKSFKVFIMKFYNIIHNNLRQFFTFIPK